MFMRRAHTPFEDREILRVWLWVLQRQSYEGARVEFLPHDPDGLQGLGDLLPDDSM